MPHPTLTCIIFFLLSTKPISRIRFIHPLFVCIQKIEKKEGEEKGKITDRGITCRKRKKDGKKVVLEVIDH